jgi:hypothetical protein
VTTLRYFIADETGELAAMSQARSYRILSGKGSLSEYAGRDLKWVEVVVEVERRAIRRVLRVLPFRITFDTSGRVDMMRRDTLAMERIAHAYKPPTVESLIRDLELDANYFWVLGESHWRKLSEVLRVSVDDLKSTLYRAADDHR